MSSADQIYFYGDLNCPFCYVEHERLIRLELHRSLPFKGVEHWRELPVPWDTGSPEFQDSIDEELERLKERAPDIEIRRPPGRSNLQRGLAALLAAEQIDPLACVDLRTGLFRALWAEGRDISDEQVVAECWRAAGLPGEPRPIDRETKRAIRLTLAEWRNAPFDQRIPVLADSRDTRLLGLADAGRIETFLAGLERGGHLPGVCRSPDPDKSVP